MDRSDLINDAERRLWDAFSRGEAVNLGPEGDPAGPGFNPDDWPGERAVRGEVIAGLMLGVRPAEPGYTAKLILEGARITGRLDLSGAPIAHELLIRRCWFDRRVDLTDSVTRSVELYSCRVPGIDARGWQAQGQVSFRRSRIECVEEGGGRPAGPPPVCVDLLGARLTGEVSFRAATLSHPDGIALMADSAVIDGSIYLDHGFEAYGKIRLAGARIGGILCFDRAKLTNTRGDAMSLDNARVGQNCFCRDGFTATGQIRMLGAFVEGQLSFNNAVLSNPGDNVLFADNLTVTQSMFLQGAKCDGLLRMRGAHIHGQMNLDNAKISNPDGMAISAEHLIVGRDMFCRWDFEAQGQIQMRDARVGGQLSFTQGRLARPGGKAAVLTSLQAKELYLDCEIDGTVDLEQARIGLLHIPRLERQPPMRLSGLTYTDLDPDPDPAVSRRVAWLHRDPNGFHPQPYEQLASYYRLIGHDREARLVLLAKRRSRRALVPWPLRMPGWLLDGLAGYGYVPLRAFCLLLFAVTVGTLAFLNLPNLPSPTSSNLVNALLFALDTIVPASPLGLRTAVQLSGASFAVAITLQILGYALVLAVVPALSRALSRSDK